MVAPQPQRFTCRGVVFAASSLGTTELLFRLKEKGSLPAISDQLGKHIRTNSESLIGVRIPGSRDDLSKGVAIGSGIYIDEHTHIEAVRYPGGSDVMGFLATTLTGGRPGSARVWLWLRNLALSMLRHPLKTVRLLQPFGWARECIILLCMQAVDATSTCAGSVRGSGRSASFSSAAATRCPPTFRRPMSSRRNLPAWPAAPR